MTKSLEELITHHQKNILIYQSINTPETNLATDILTDTVELLKMVKKNFGNIRAENYIVSMNTDDYKQFLEFKKYQQFKEKQDAPLQVPESH